MVKTKGSKQRAWTKQEVSLLRSLAKQKMPAGRIARALRRSLHSTKKKASRLEVPLGQLTRWSKDDLRRLRTLAKKKRSVSRIAKSLRRTIYATEKAASKHGISLDWQE